MSLVLRGNRAYEYRSVRRNGRVTSEYLGGGVPAECVAIRRRMDERQRAGRERERADWEAERGRLADAERHAAEVDAAYDDLATLAMLATGHHRPQRGRWRRRRTMASEIEAKRPAAIATPALPTAAEMGALLDSVDVARAEGADAGPRQRAAWEAAQGLRLAAQSGDASALPAIRVILDRRPRFFNSRGMEDVSFEEAATLTCSREDLLGQELVVRELRASRDELAGPGAPALERLLAERVALARYDAYQADIRAARSAVAGCSMQQSEYISRQQSRSQARFLAAAKSLATVRRLAMPVLHVHREEAPSGAPASSRERLRVLTDGSN